jgi:hypothetical protein
MSHIDHIPEPFEIGETRLEYGIRYTRRRDGQERTFTRAPLSRVNAEYDARLQRDHLGNPDARVVVREVVTLAWREVETHRIENEIAITLRGQANEVDHNWSDETAIAIAAHLREVADLFERRGR